MHSSQIYYIYTPSTRPHTSIGTQSTEIQIQHMEIKIHKFLKNINQPIEVGKHKIK